VEALEFVFDELKSEWYEAETFQCETDMNEYIKGVYRKYNNPIDGQIYLLIF
jgi:hypothetical protein